MEFHPLVNSCQLLYTSLDILRVSPANIAASMLILILVAIVRTQLFSVIPYACAATTILLAVVSDRVNKKGIFLAGTITISIIGYGILLSTVPVAGKIVATCFVTSGLYPSVILLNSWLLANSCGYTKRATVWALTEVFGPCFSILGSHIYDTPPRFIKGHAVGLAFLLAGLIDTFVLMWWMNRANMRKEVELREYHERGETHPHRGKSLEEVNDNHVDFRYII